MRCCRLVRASCALRFHTRVPWLELITQITDHMRHVTGHAEGCCVDLWRVHFPRVGTPYDSAMLHPQDVLNFAPAVPVANGEAKLSSSPRRLTIQCVRFGSTINLYLATESLPGSRRCGRLHTYRYLLAAPLVQFGIMWKPNRFQLQQSKA